MQQGEVLLLIEAHQVENVKVVDHELKHVQRVGRGVTVCGLTGSVEATCC